MRGSTVRNCWRVPLMSVAWATLAAAISCQRDEASGPLTISADMEAGSEEGEFFGSLLLNGVPITDSGYTISLAPADAPTANRLHYHEPSMWVNPAGYVGHDGGGRVT